jgi:NAD(P)-dependent dehydrogenase (short-subunit alcohol dehydrogenase family)
MTGELVGKSAVVTGGSRGIGFAIARRLAADGADLVIAASNADRLTAAGARIAETSGRRVETCAGDLRTLEGCAAVHAKAAATLGGIDILVNCAGATKAGDFLELDDGLWADGFALKFHAAVRLARLFWPMLAARNGTVVNIIGGAARTPAPDFMIGGAVNAALANFSKALAARGLKDDVNVNVVHPGMTVTERLQELFEARAKAAGTTADEIRRRSIEGEGIRRLGEPEDVADLVAFLCSPRARHVHGVAIAVDGGATRGLY